VSFIRASLIDVFLTGAVSWACLSFTSLPCAQDTGGWNPCIDTKDVLKLLIVGDSAVRLLVTLERAPRGEKPSKRLPNGRGAAEAKVAALHPERHQSLLSKLSTKEGG
jgi:hypothetical protein